MGALHPRVPAASKVALRANIETYEHFDDHAVISGSPHLKHRSIGALYRALIDEAIAHSDKSPTELSVLELGAGNGLASVPWFKKKVRLTAVDSSETMLRQLKNRAEAYRANPRTITKDVFEYLGSTEERFDVVSQVSMLHHIPNYLRLLSQACAHVRTGGSLLTFQDPLRYDTLPKHDHLMDRASYFAWRLGQGNYIRGLKTRWRRLRHVYDPNESVDFEEYHWVRNGVDSAAIMAQLQRDFSNVKIVSYWSTFSAPLQWLGERLDLKTTFGILASGRKPV